MQLQLLLLLVLGLLLSSAAATASTTHDAAVASQHLQQLRQAVQQQPGSPLPHVQLALALHTLNHQLPDGGSRVAEAEAEYRKALALISPHGAHASIYVHVQGNLGALLLSADRPAEAITELQAALALGQQLVQQAQQQSSSKQKKKQAQQQQQEAEELHEIEQQLGGIMFNLGKALTSVGRLAEADALYAQAAAAAHGRDFGSYGKALAAMSSMQPNALTQALQACQAATQHFAAQQQPQLAFLRDASPAAAAAAAAAVDTDASGSTAAAAWLSKADSADLVWLHFALFKYYQHAKQTELAWHYLQLGNRIMAAHVTHDAAKEQRNLEAIKSIFKAPFVTSGLQEDRTAVFVVGMPRSGSTLVEQMLASHSQVAAAGEDTALAPLTTAINKALASSPPADHPALLQNFAQQYLDAMHAKVSTPAAAWPGPTDDADNSNQQRQQQQHQRPRRIVDKMLRNLWLVGYIHMLLPRACIVHVVRHPMDVALSCYAQPFGYSASALAWSWDLSAIAGQLRMTWELAEHWEQQLPGRVHTVFYEELVERPESVAAQLLSACGLDWEPSVLEFQHLDRPVQTASMVQVRQPLYKSAVARWKLYGQQLEPLREALTPLIGRYEQMLAQRLATAPVSPQAAVGGGSAAVAGDTDSGGDEFDARDEL